MSLIINQLSVSIETTSILSQINLQIVPGSIHALMGPNGSGKSSLAYTIMGHPRYTITNGALLFHDSILNPLSADKRAKMGIFLSFQQPHEIPGVLVSTFLKAAYDAIHGVTSVAEFTEYMHKAMTLLEIPHYFAQRNINEGFSGGEKKRFEMLQLVLLKPKLILLDEIDSGLDVDALKVVARAFATVKEENPQLACIIITHYHRILEYIVPDAVHIMHKGSVITSGDKTVVNTIECKGYNAFCSF